MTAREGDRCPAEGCHWVVVLCECGDVEGDHLICLGCGQDADQDRADVSDPCDCGPDDQPDPDDPNYR